MMELPAFDDPHIPVMAFIISPEAQLNPLPFAKKLLSRPQRARNCAISKKVLAKPTQIKQQKQK